MLWLSMKKHIYLYNVVTIIFLKHRPQFRTVSSCTAVKSSRISGLIVSDHTT